MYIYIYRHSVCFHILLLAVFLLSTLTIAVIRDILISIKSLLCLLLRSISIVIAICTYIYIYIHIYEAGFILLFVVSVYRVPF